MTQANNVAIESSQINSSGVLQIAGGGTGSSSAATVAGTGITVSGTFPNQTVTNSGVTSVAAGTGISVSASTGGVTITNTSSVNSSQLCKAWVSWVGSSGSINSSYNVSSVTRNSTGNYTVNFTSSFSNANYAIVFGGNRNNSATDAFGMNFYSQSTGSVIVNTSVSANGYTDATAACIACFA